MRMLLVAALAITPMLAKDNEPAKRLAESAAVFSEIMATPTRASEDCWLTPTDSHRPLD